MTGARDGDVGEPGVEQVRVDAGIGVHEHAVGCEPLRAVAVDGVAVVEMAMLASAKFNLPIVVEASSYPSVRCNKLDDS